MKRLWMMLVLTLIALFVIENATAAESKKEQAQAMVQKAIKFFKANGKARVIEAITEGKFREEELYVFAYNTEGVVIAHPVNKTLIGKNLLDVPDDAGKLFRKEIVQKAKKSGSGWVDYKYKNPKTDKIEHKTTYFKKVKDIIFCCGIYK